MENGDLNKTAKTTLASRWKRWSPAILLAGLALSNTSFLSFELATNMVRSEPENSYTFASRIPRIPKEVSAEFALNAQASLYSKYSNSNLKSLPTIKSTNGANMPEMDFCGTSKNLITNENVDLYKLFLATAEVTAETAAARVQVNQDANNNGITNNSKARLVGELAFAESLYANLSELERQGFHQVELMNGGDEAMSFCLPKLIDEALGKSAIYANRHEKLSKLTNYLGRQGVAHPENLAHNLLYVQEKIKK